MHWGIIALTQGNGKTSRTKACLWVGDWAAGNVHRHMSGGKLIFPVASSVINQYLPRVALTFASVDPIREFDQLNTF